MLEGLLARAKTDERRTAIEADLSGPPLPPAGAYLWTWFNELNLARPSGGMGVAAITYPDIEAWCRLLRRKPAPWEIDILKGIDGAFIRVMSQRDGSA